nr:uncharacterized protein LOC129267226 [Lytechinus pictus]
MALFEPGGFMKWMQSHWYLLVVIISCLSISGANAECNCTSDCIVNCSSGQYSNSSGDCLECPPGFYCDGGTLAPAPCDAQTYNPDPGGSTAGDCTPCPSGGYFSLAGAETCTLCPAGSECNSATGVITQCSDGQYSLVGDMTCLECPDGLYCPSVYNEPMVCPSGYVPFSNQTGCEECGAGTYAYNGTVSCQQCPPGYQCPTSGLDEPTPCPTGYFSSASGSETCSQCAQGYYCNSTAQTICDLGYHSNAGATSCTECPDGYSCSGPEGPVICLAGTYAGSGSDSCTSCEAGFYCPLNGTTEHIQCADGYYTTGLNSEECTECTAGYYCTPSSVAPCAAGYYSNGGATSCLQCPGGYSCSGTGEPIQCLEGTHSFNGSESCTSCDAGFYCPLNGTVAQIQCPDGYYNPGSSPESCLPCSAGYYCTPSSELACDEGYYSDSLATSCSSCPGGFECPGGGAAASQCQEGYYARNGSSACSPCDVGHYCLVNGTIEPVICVDGYFSNTTGASECTLCEAGYFCNAISQMPCEAGSSSSAGETSCSTCSGGFECPGGGTTANQCGEGYYARNGSSSCSPCDVGHYCPLSGTFEPIICPEDSYSSSSGASQCAMCTAGYYCSPSSISPCAAGYYSNAGATSCLQCPGGYSCNGTGEPIQCLVGSYSFNGSESCSSCDAGFYCPLNGTIEQSQCPDGYYNPGSSPESCLPCSAGYYCTPSSQVACDEGYYSDSLATSCSSCPGGFECPGGGATASQCQEGYYARNGSSACSPCDVGHYCLVSGTIEPVVCADGYFSNTTGASECTQCEAGYFCNAISQMPCEAGSSSSAGETSCSTCPGGYECPGGGALATICDPGYYALNGSSSCTECEIGFFCPISGTVERTACTTGYYANETGSQSCEQCPEGYRCTSSHLSPVICPRGSYASAGSTSCTSCNDGEYADSTGLSSCMACPEGYSCNNTMASPLICAPGTYSPWAVKYCLECPDGSYQDSPGQASCEACTAGSACLDKTSAPVPCPDGYYSLANATTCIPCPGGYQCTVQSADPVLCTAGSFAANGSAACQDCPVGFYCPFDGLLEPIGCIDGTFSNETNAISCMVCPAGSECLDHFSTPSPCSSSYYSLGGNTTCTICPAGYRCPTTDAEPIICQAGQYASLAQTSCQDCPKGSYCPYDGSSAPTVCSAGWYADSLGNVNCTTCPMGYQCADETKSPEACPPGYYTDQTGQETCITCAAGTYQTASMQTSCTECPANFRCPNNTQEPIACEAGFFSTSGSTSCASCPVGQACGSSGQGLCQVGEYSNGTDCLPCPQGFMCPSPLGNPQACPTGTYQDTTGKSTCYLCPGGSSCLSVSGSPTPCDTGYYSVSGQQVCSICPEGKWSDDGASSCSGCPAGHECLNGTDRIKPQNCSAGTYAAEGAGVCTPCPLGMFSLEQASSCTPCPVGSLCLVASDLPSVCPTGTYSGLGEGLQCTDCPAGFYCPDPTNVPQSCPYGTYSSARNDSCTPCPEGMSCLDPADAPAPCDSGYYSPEMIPMCLLCPAGDSCSISSTSNCTEGEYSLAGEETCTACPSGYACPFTDQPPVACTYGHSTNGSTGHTECSPCPAGMYCSDPSLAPSTCGEGSYSLPLSTECTNCPAGYACPTTGEAPTPCEPGYYSVAAQTSCTPCPAGQACPSTSDPTAAVNCLEGSYSLGNQSTCTICQPGYICPNTTTDANIAACPAGSYARLGAAYCTTCPAGWQCPQADGSGNAKCSSGYFSEGGLSECHACPAGYQCPSTTSNSSVPCGFGYYADEGARSCTRCPPGKECPDRDDSSTIVDCDEGYYSGGGQESCTICPAGKACPYTSSTYQMPCSDGYYALTGSTECTPCPAGSFCNDTKTSPETCADGYYSEGLQTACTPCPIGHYCPVTDQVPVICDAGYYSNQSSVACSTCDPGYACSEGSTSRTPTEGLCKQGYYCEDGLNELACPAGTFGNRTGAATAAEGCAACPEGYFCPQDPVIGTPSAEYLCPRGYFCEFSTETSTEHPCAAGTYGTGLGFTTQDDCSNCPIGKYCPAGTSLPRECPKGYYCPEGTGAADENPCLDGTFTEVEGAESQGECKTCPAGYYCPSGTDTPQACPAGTFNPTVGQNEVTDCNDCTAGFACTTVALVEPDTHCYPGYFCPAGSDSPNDADNACPAGTFNDYHNLTASFQCEECEASFACYEGTGGLQLPPAVCAQGHYCPAGTQHSDQYPCPAGSWTNQTNLKAVDECYECPRGYYCLEAATEPTELCPTGHYCPAGTQSANQYPCHEGSYSNERGNIRWEQCVDCTEGHYCPEGSSLPTACPAGTFREEEEGGSEDDCSQCTEGHYCNGTGNVEATECSKGTYSDWGATSCTTCEPGYYCDERATTQTNMYAYKICPAGVTCAAGRISAPDLFNDACVAGSYCLSGDKDPYPRHCPNGTFSDETGLIQESECQICPKGQYCNPTGLTAPAGDCPGGHFCPEGTADQYANPCSASFYLNASAGEDSQGCTLCIAGYYCPTEGLSWPVECPQGFFCPAGSQYPSACPTGTYGNSTLLRRSEDCTPCPGGYYCEGAGNLEPTDVCDAGFFCAFKAVSSAPVDGFTGGVCPPGGYCPAGTAYPANCPLGTYSNSSGSKSADDCIACDPGYYCAGDNNPEPTGPCEPGYFCTGGSGTSIQHEVPEGHYSGSAAYKAEPCERGSYQTARKSSYCLDCPQGAYCNESGTATPAPCLSGHYCPPRTIIPVPCPTGTHRVETSAQEVGDCTICPPGKFCGETGLIDVSGDCAAGHFCIGGADTSHPYETDCANATILGGGECPAGYYCPEGTETPTSYPCQNGTYLNVTGGKEIEDCLDCPGGEVCGGYALTEPNELCAPGYFCAGKAKTKYPTDGETGNICPVGHYCPEGSPAAMRCPDGEYNNITGRAECFTCPQGFYCADGERLLACPRGHYCPEGTGSNGSIPCPRGTYNPDLGLASVDQCQPCAPGYYCTQLGAYTFGIANASAGPCDPGYFCQSGVNISNPDGETNSGIGGPCPKGFFCPQQTSVPQPCPNGTYSDSLYLYEEGQCEECDPGFYCGTYNLTAPQAPCDPGFYCHYGSSYPNPIGDDITGAPCPVGTYCEEGSSEPIGCPAGTYNEITQQSECQPCPAGWYCPGNVSDFRPYDCPAGYYCPNGTEHAYQYPCPKGTYRPDENGQTLSDCTICDSGKYCAYEGNTTVTGDCDEGYFCIQGAWTAKPMDFDNYTDGDCLCPSLSTGGRCQPGYYCPRGSFEPEECTEGNYCDVEGLADVAGKCMEGFYCISTAVRPDPTDGITGDICPRGRYCGNGTGANPPMCPSGTFSNGTGLRIEEQCTNCTAGSYCEDPALTEPTGLCDPGYYCPVGQSSSNPFPCGEGYYCEEGSPSETACESGTYQDETGQSSCKICNGGYYCDVANAPISDYTNFPCPVGHYCLNGTEYNTQYPCPAGKYNPSERLEREDQCLDCPAGKFSDTPGQDNWVGNCAAGFWCIGASASATPNDGVTGVECPAGKYCVEGTPTPENCPVGTWSDSLGLEKASDCYPCSGGFYCNGTGLTAPSGPCDPGYYCSSNSSTPTPEDGGITGDPCTEGHYCPGETTSPLPCEAGTYTTTTHRSECDTCPARFFCTTGYEPEECPHGFYCPAGTGYDWQPCPTGTFSNMAGLANETQCTLCSPGKFCSEINSTMVTGDCEAGYYCTEGSDTATPEVTFKGVAGVCPEGSYCPVGSDTPTPCPRGTFGNVTKLTNASECTPCLYGQYCEDVGLTAPTGDCYAGFYCLRGAKDPNNPTVDSTGGPCPVGHYCPNGTSYPLDCEAGTYNNQTGQSECDPCPPGYYCETGDVHYADTPCPTGHYCPEGTKSSDEFPCPKGYYNDYEGKQELVDCKPCTPGQYCGTPGLSAPTDPCAPGWYCIRGAWSSMPTDYGFNNITTSCFCSSNATGGQCSPGEFCPEGSIEPTSCTRGYYCEEYGMSNVTGPCDPGYYCTLGASEATPTDNVTGAVCPAGHYCPEATYDPIPCPAGYYVNTTRSVELDDCMPCLPGYYCEGTGLPEPTGPCQAGYYCPGGQNTSQPTEYICTPGHYCEAGSSGLTSCASGTYQDDFGMDSCKSCPAGFYCDATLQNDTFCSHSVQNPQPCPQGHYCPMGTKYSKEFPCPNGTFSDQTNLEEADDCTPCSGGMYCDRESLTAPYGECEAGYYCISGASSPTPTDGVTGDICPVGTYCPTGSNKTYDCPPSTYNPTEGRESISECLACDAGEYCPVYGLNTTAGDCDAGFYCAGNASSASPTDGVTGDECPVGHRCPAGSPQPIQCEPGTYTDTTQNEACLQCTPGHYCITGSNPEDCPAGFYCPEGTGHVWQSCPAGTFSPSTGLSNETQCTQCTAGNYCDVVNATTVSGPCDGGFYCRSGSDARQPSESSRGDAGVCPEGYYCVQGTGEPEPCPPSTFNNVTGISILDECQDCLEGHYCEIPGLSYPSGECDPGFYCHLGSNSSNPSVASSTGGPCPAGSFCVGGNSDYVLCPPGYYQPNEREDNCLDCPEGHYCEEGSSNYTICPKGHFCPLNTEFATENPCNNGTFNNATGGSDVNACELCPAGMYCPERGMEEPAGLCAPGWYCILGAWKDMPTSLGNDTDFGCACPNDTTGGRCLAGTYCPAGASQPIQCDPGYYCRYDELANVSGLCEAGHYCIGSTILPNPVNETTGDICPKGHYCPEGSYDAQPCEPGKFTNQYGNQAEGDCQPCTAGMYCAGWGRALPNAECDLGWFCHAGSTAAQPNGSQCLPGHRCPVGSPDQIPCPSGEYQPFAEQGECVECPAGSYCDRNEAIDEEQSGVGAPSHGVVMPKVCPAGFYCPNGTETAREFPCPVGTYSNTTELESEAECRDCPEGFYCEAENITEPTGLCSPGYYCVLRAYTPQPDGSDSTGGPCEQGTYCTEGSSYPTHCPKGTFGHVDRLPAESNCTDCWPGYYCNEVGLTEPNGTCYPGFYCSLAAIEPNPNGQSYGDVCPVGHFCPEGSYAPEPCPAGTYQPHDMMTNDSACLPCTPGMYCNTTGQAAETGECYDLDIITPPVAQAASFQPLAFRGVNSGQVPIHLTWAQGECKTCPAGYYCPSGTDTPQACPAGTFNPTVGQNEVSDCNPCTAGFACTTVALVEPDTHCYPGYFCPAGSDSPNDADNACPAGTFNDYHNLTASFQCEECEASFACYEGTGGLQLPPAVCAQGHYCPAGTQHSDQYPCPAGSWTNQTNLKAVDECYECPRGYYCLEAATEPTELCPTGHYCPAGTQSANQYPCHEGSYSNERGNIRWEQCVDCTEGHYCPEGSSLPTACPAGTFREEEEGGSEDDCSQCTEGHYCNGTGNVEATECSKGTYSVSMGRFCSGKEKKTERQFRT